MMKNPINATIKDEMRAALLKFFEYDEMIVEFYRYLLEVCIGRYLNDSYNMRKYNSWFFLYMDDVMEDTKLDDQEIVEKLRTLTNVGLIDVKDGAYDGSILMRVNTSLLPSIVKIYGKKKED